MSKIIDSKSKDYNKSTPNTSSYTDVKFWFAVLILVVYLIFLCVLLFQVKILDDLTWTRMLYLFTGVEAIVFAAIGYVFGKDVYRKTAENAIKTADDKEQEAKIARKKEEEAIQKANSQENKALQLKTAIETYSANNSSSFKKVSENIKGIKDDDSLKSLLQESANSNYLVDFANKLFKDDRASWLTFQWTIEPADKIQSVNIGGHQTYKKFGTCTGLPSPNNTFIIEVETQTGHDEWTFKTFNILNEDGDSMTQENGQMTSSNAREVIKMIK